MNGRIQSGIQLLARYTDFLVYVTENDFAEPPTHGCFCRWLSKQSGDISVKKARELLGKHLPEVKEQMMDLLADALSAGALKGKYNATITTLCLKNLCDWSDKHKGDSVGGFSRWEDMIDGLHTEFGKADDSAEKKSEK